MLQYLKTREFWLAMGGIILLFILLFLGFFWLFMPLYTRHSAAVSVPDFNKMTLTEAAEVMDKEGLTFEVADSVFFPNMKPLAIVNQDPPALSKVKPGRRIFLTVNKQTAPLVKLPQILHVSLYQARIRLDNWGLEVGSVSERASDMKNLVLEVREGGKLLKPGDMLSVGSKLDIVIGKGLDDQKTELPDLVGLPYTSAIIRLQELGLSVATPLKFNPKATEPPGTIIRQDPVFSEGDSVAMGTEFTLFISGEEPKEANDISPDSLEQ